VASIPTLEERMDDVRAVMDAVGSHRAALFGLSEGGPMSVLFAATYPHRTAALILYGSFARRAWAPDHPWGRREEELENVIAGIERNASGEGPSVSRPMRRAASPTPHSGAGTPTISGSQRAQARRRRCTA
jgi:pimeloyl-ACP methyl ester carboxylesterase